MFVVPSLCALHVSVQEIFSIALPLLFCKNHYMVSWHLEGTWSRLLIFISFYRFSKFYILHQNLICHQSVITFPM
jgi:hypothetical protein